MSVRTHTIWIASSIVIAGLFAACSDRHQRSEATEEGAEGTEAREPSGRTLTIKGSDTMVILAQKWAEKFMEKNEGVALQVSGGGSGTGIAALINGTTDLANSSREMKDSEREQLKERRGAEAHETRVALDALAVYVHADNPLESISIEQLRRIYRGELDNWSELGGQDEDIILYGRENNSGTYAYFKEHVLDDLDFAPRTQTLSGTAAVINAVSRDDAGIGYGGIAYSEGVRAIKVSEGDQPPLEPTMENATSGRYPLARYLHIYSAGEPDGLPERFIEFVLSEEGQSIIEGVGYYPLPDDAAALEEPSQGEAPEGEAETSDESAEGAEAATGQETQG